MTEIPDRATSYWYISPRPESVARADFNDRLLRRHLNAGELPPGHLVPAYRFIDPQAAYDFPMAMGVGMMSRRMRDVLIEHSAPGEILDWMPVSVWATEWELDYWIPLWPVVGDVYEERFTTRDGDGRIIRWVLDERKIAGRHVFRVPAARSGFVASTAVTTRLRGLGLHGVYIDPART